MRLRLYRNIQDAQATIGTLHVEGEPFCFTLEDEKREIKVADETRIPSGEYEIKIRNEGGMNKRYQEKFGILKHRGMLHLQDVPNFEWIYIHIGNTENHTSGCILVGFGSNIMPFSPWKVTQSTDAYCMLAEMIYKAIDDGESVHIEVID
jgi:hypothetical protein